MRIADLYAASSERGEPVLSFEFFPPKTERGFSTLFRTIEELKQLSPGWVSVTMGAGGSTRSKTVDLVSRIEHELGLVAMTHLPCVGFSRDEVRSILERLREARLENLLALSGDPPNQGEGKSEGAFRYASELVGFVRSEGFDFCIGAGCYPETHPAAENAAADLRNLKRKVDAGVDFLVTQLFFDNADYFDFVDRARAAGIGVPIVPGIMPIVSAGNIRRITSLCGSRIPAELSTRLDRVAEDEAATAVLGVEWATAQCRELLERSVPGIHFYTLNRSPATREIARSLFSGAGR